MAKITVDGVEYEVDASGNLLQACLSHGLDLPYFCWHPCMGSVGACRQCAVKQYRNDEDDKGTLVMACMTPAADGSRLSIRDPQAVKFRASVIESLMISHPHDCPVCEEGGECHLQDMTQMSGHNYRRYEFNKVTHRNQYLGPFINHEMNRCITCYRCVRFYNDYAGGDDLAALASHHHVYFGRHEEGSLQNEFSGNLVEVCPTGVFTDKTFSRQYTRKWDLQTAPSICTGCSVGCNTTPGEREGRLRRIVNRYHHDINGYFLCDRGRFGHGHTQSPQRLKPVLPQEEAFRKLHQLTGKRTIGIGSPRASLESNLALRETVGAKNFYAGFSDATWSCLQEVLALYRQPDITCPDLHRIEQSDCVLIINEDITSTAARMALSVRQATRNVARTLAAANKIPEWQDAAVRELAQHSRSPLFIISNQGTRLDDVATECVHTTLQDQIAQLASISACLDAGKSAPESAAQIAQALLAAENPVLISGISAESPELTRAVAALASSLQQAREKQLQVCFALPEANTLGLALLLETGGRPLSEALQRLENGKADTLLVMENDLSRRCSSQALAAAMASKPSLIVLDQISNDFNAAADLLLPVASFAEQHGTWINYEGRAQSSWQVFLPEKGIMASCEWLGHDTHALWKKLEHLQPFQKLRELEAFMHNAMPGMKSPRQAHRYSGRTALEADLHVHERQQPQDTHSDLSFSMEGVPYRKDATLLSSAWAPGWNSNQAISKFQEEINGELKQGCKGVHLISAGQPVADRDAMPELEETGSSNSQSPADSLSLFQIQHLFGSEPLSALAPAIIERSCEAYLSVGPDTAARLGLQQHGRVRLHSGNCTTELPVVIRHHIAENTVGVYCGGTVNPHDLSATATLEPLPADPDLIARQLHSLDMLLIPDRAREVTQ